MRNEKNNCNIVCMSITDRMPEQEYNIIKNSKSPMTWVGHLIAKGTPLPKGHDRLIYAKDVGEYLTLADAPTIIEAD